MTWRVTADEPADNLRGTTMTSAREVFDRDQLARICEMHETDFEKAFGMERIQVEQPAPDDFYLYRDNGASILAVAHLDTVGRAWERSANFVETEAGLVVFSRALDDRLGAYIILDMLPKLGVNVDLLLTVGEESGLSTAAYFEPPPGKDYEWMIEFDRGGTDVVMYQYDDDDVRALVRAAGARPADGIFSDISYLEHLEIKGFNWGVGYQDYHGPKAHAYLDDTFMMVDRFLTFHEQNVGRYMPHEQVMSPAGRWSAGWSASWDDKWDEDFDPPREWWAGVQSFNEDEDAPLDERDPFYFSEHYVTSEKV